MFLIPLQAMAALYGTILGPTSTLVELDPATGAVLTTIGSVGYRVNGMTYDATTNTMYATTSNGDASFPDGLISINLATGAGTEIGTGAGQYVNVPTANSAGVLYGWTEDTDDAVLWDKVAGTITVLGSSGISTLEQSLAFDNSDTLYYVSINAGGIQTINTTTGAATSGPAISGATGYALHHGDFAPGTTLLYALTDIGTGPRDIDILDVTTGVVTNTLTQVPDGLHTLAFTAGIIGSVAQPVPSLSGYALVLMMLSLLIMAGRHMRAPAKPM